MASIEVVHHMKTKTRGKVGETVLKLDISKAYDIIDQNYLKDILSIMDFCQKWIGGLCCVLKQWSIQCM